MRRVRLWSVTDTDDGGKSVSDVPTVENTETENLLENLLVQSPGLLMDGLTLIGRQVPTDGGPLDLLGVDQDGGLLVFELKKGTLTREAVAQVLDYASDLAVMDVARFARLIEDASGKNGVEKIEDFADWYGQKYPGRESALETPPRMVLVGLGVDRRAVRIANFLAETGVSISVLTFNAFRQDAGLLLARQVESEEPQRPIGTERPTRQGNLQVLQANARSLQVQEFLNEVSDFVRKRIPGTRSTGKLGYSFSLTETTGEGKPALRVYLNVLLNWRSDGKGTLWLSFQPRAVRLLGSDLDVQLPVTVERDKWGQTHLLVTPETWPQLQPHLERILPLMVQRSQASAIAEEEQGADQTASDDGSEPETP